MNSRQTRVAPPSLKPFLKRARSQSSSENDRPQPRYNSQSNRGNSSKRHWKDVQRNESMPRKIHKGQQVQWADRQRDVRMTEVYPSQGRGQQVQRADRKRDVRMTDAYHSQGGGQHVQRADRKRDVRMTEAYPSQDRGQQVQRADKKRDVRMTGAYHCQGGGQHVQRADRQRDVRMTEVYPSQGRGQQVQRADRQRDFRMTDVHSSQGRNQQVQRADRQRDVRMTEVSHGWGRGQHVQRDARMTDSKGSAQHAQRVETTVDFTDSDVTQRNDPLEPVEAIRCKQLLAQIYADIHAVSLPGAIQATADLTKLTLLERRQFSMHSWFQCNAALQTRSIFKVIEYAVAERELYESSRLTADVSAAANSVRLQPDNGLGRMGLVAKVELRLAFRHAGVAEHHGFMMLSILATSAAYREAARTLDDATWDSFGMCIQANFSSLEYFAKIRGLDWLAALRRIPQFQQTQPYVKQRFPDLQADHPHTYIVPRHKEPLRRPKYKGRDQVPIQSNQYSSRSFGRHDRPKGWPFAKSYPSDPTVTTKVPCYLCSQYKCACDTLDCDVVVKPLVEIINYGEKGNGIRVLQPIKKGDILDEYVGEIKHASDMDDNVYSFSLDFEDSSSFAYIDAQFLGNWTRFINHSCDASAKFELKVIGRRLRAMIVATKDVDMFDELTIDYGAFFWMNHNSLCKCGSPNCENVDRRITEPMDLCRDPPPTFRKSYRTGGN